MCVTFPAGPIFGFFPPSKKLKVGDTWDSKSIMPFNLLREDNSPKISDLSGKFKLSKVKIDKNKNEIATITWVGKATMEADRPGQIADLSWSRTIKHNITKNQVISNNGTFQMNANQAGQQMCVSVVVSSIYKFPKSTQTKPKDEIIPDKPKDDEDE